MIFIKVLKFRGKNGGFATQDSDMWTVSLVNDQTGKSISLDNWQTGGRGYSAKRYAMEVARPYSELLGIPIKEMVKKVSLTFIEEEINHVQ